MKKVDKNGYLRNSEDPTRCAWDHIRVAEQKLGRSLGKSEQVHHINGDKTDNRPDNIMVMRTNADHRCLHSNFLYELFKTEDGSYVAVKRQIECKHCGRLFVPNDYRNSFCSVACYKEDKTSAIPDKLELERLVWEMPSTKVAKIYNVSDRTIGKWCVKLGIEKPPRGYWTKEKSKVLRRDDRVAECGGLENR